MAGLRNEPTQQRSRDTLDNIISAADALFAERGVDGATNSMIADQAGVAIGTLYRFFPNKSALVAEYLDRYLSELGRLLPDLPESPTLDDIESIVAGLIDRSVKARLQFRGYGRVRLWSYPDTGELASKAMRESELALVGHLLESSPYPFEPDQRKRMAVVIVDAPWPLVQGLIDLPASERAVMQEEIVRLIVGYVREIVNSL